MMIDTLRALTIAINSLRYNPEVDPDTAGQYEKVLTDLRDKLGCEMTEDSNAPLTLDELRKMVGQPVWIERNDSGKNMWVIVGDFESPYGVYFGTAKGGMRLYYDDYRDAWLAYRRKSEEGEDNA